MKKVVIATALIVTLGISSSARAFNWGAGVIPFPFAVPQKQVRQKPTTQQHYLEIIELLKKQLEQTKKTHQSITENRQFRTSQTDYTSFFLKNPELVYDENSNSDISTSIKNILLKEKASTSFQESRNAITKRIQYTTAADKAVSLKTFQDAEKRFQQISELVEKINKTADLKSVADLQAHIAGMLAMIQNETAKLQMVNYSHNTEQAFISQQKKTYSMKILSSQNKEMPIIRSIR